MHVWKLKRKPLSHTENLLSEYSKNIKTEMGEHVKSLVAQVGVSQNANDPQAKNGDSVGYLKINVDDFAKNNIAVLTTL